MKQALKKTWLNYQKSLPILFGMLVLVSLLEPYLKKFYGIFFSGNYIVDPIIGSFLGSVSAGMPITAYVLGGELLSSGVSLLAVTAFTLTWTTVGLAFLPMESNCLGRKFAIVRNTANYFFAIIISIITVVLTSFISHV